MPHLVAPHIRALQAYEPGKPEEELRRELGLHDIVKLSSNENAYGPSPHVLEAIAGDEWPIHRYPDAAGHDLRHALAAHHSIPVDHIMLGSGSNELIDMLCRVCACRGEHAVFGHPSFPSYRISVVAQELAHTAVPLRDDIHWNVDDLLDAIQPDTRLLFLSNPNNPTGSYLGAGDLARLLAEAPDEVLVVLDEAYVQYVEAQDYRPATEFREARERLAILRTFSKAYGLAALRVGYILSTPELVADLNRLRAPFNVGSFGQRAALIALDDQEHLTTTVGACLEQRGELTAALETRELVVAPSQANFVLVKMPGAGRAVYEALLHQGVIVRPMAPPLESWIRVTVGRPEDNTRFLDALDRVLGGSRG